MEPRIQYVSTPDAVSIAYWALGEGITLMMPPPAMPFSHIEHEWRIPEWRHWYEHLSQQCRVVRYDGRGSGLSDRISADGSLETQLTDLEAVMDAAGAEQVALFGCFYTGPLCIAYALRHPERVSHLILWNSFSNCADGRQEGSSDVLASLMEANWELFTETLAHTLFGWSEGEPAHRMAEYMRASVSPMNTKAHFDAALDLDLTPELHRLDVPTLIMHRRQFQTVPLSVARHLAANIAGARLEIVNGASVSPYVGEWEEPLQLIGEFIGADTAAMERVAHARARTAGGFRTVMFTDMAGSTAATQRMGDAQAQDLVRTHNRIVRDALHAFSGTEVKHTGDGIMASFDTVTSALECAIQIQRGIDTADAGAHAFELRIGINAGEPVIEGDDLFGTAVQLASRICTRAEPGQVLVSDVVRQLVAGKGFLFADHGEAALRGFEDPVRIFELRWRGDAV